MEKLEVKLEKVVLLVGVREFGEVEGKEFGKGWERIRISSLHLKQIREVNSKLHYKLQGGIRPFIQTIKEIFTIIQ